MHGLGLDEDGNPSHDTAKPATRLLSLTQARRTRSGTYGPSRGTGISIPAQSGEEMASWRPSLAGSLRCKGKKDGSVTRQQGPGPPPAPVARQRRGQGEGGGAALRADANCI